MKLHLCIRFFPPSPSLTILEAGCGRKWPLDGYRQGHTLIGLDADPAALAARTDLDQAILGDLRTHDFSENSFDIIYCSNVLEHIDGAEAVMDRFVRWLKPGGLLMIQIPVAESVYGWVTKHTSFWVHVAYYRYILGKKTAGQPGYAPYPTYYDPVVSLRGMRAYCERRGIRILAEYGQHYWVKPIQKIVATMVYIASLGQLTHRFNSVGWVVQK